ncbi:MAG: hypothetical protein C0591_02310, partial [Marinilabiliales bacterium]
GIFFKEPTGKITVSNNNFIQNIVPLNESNRSGGGICLLDAYETEVIFDANYFNNNEAYNGGGIFSRSSFNLLVTNNVFEGNESHIGGGMGIFHPAGKSKLSSSSRGFNQPTLINNTFTNNSVDYRGGALHFQCEEITPIILNSIFWENSAIYGNDVYYWAGTSDMTISYCDIDPDDIYGNWGGINNFYQDPVFIDSLCHVDTDSPCFNTGIDIIEIEGITFNCPDSDYDGDPRPSYGNVDIGADEFYVIGILHNYFTDEAKIQLRAYPNPFTVSTTIEFKIPYRGFAGAKVYDMLGNKI